MDLTAKQIEEIDKIVQGFIPDAKHVSDIWHWAFQNQCGCYSEWTTDACWLRVGYWSSFVNPKDYALRVNIETALEKWAHENLEWHGCECCENQLYVNTYLFDKDYDRE